jgi:hypothetical protein
MLLQTGTVYESLRLGGFLTLRSARVAPTETLTYNGHVIPPGVRTSYLTTANTY